MGGPGANMRKHRKSEQDPNRREFMWHAACAAVGATAMASTVWDLRLINAAVANTSTHSIRGATAPDYKALVCLFLFGGNDANNLLVPTDSSDYAAYSSARGVLALPNAGQAGGVLPLNPLTSDGRTYGLHPSCPELTNLFNTGKAALMCNVGTLLAPITRTQYLNHSVATPPQLFSHNDQQIQWQTSVPDQPIRTGWGGRCADMLYSMNTNNTVSMSISLAGSNTFEVGNTVSEYNVSSGAAVGLTTSHGAAQAQALKDLIALNHPNLYEQSYAATTINGINNAAVVNSAISGINIATAFPNTSLGQQLKMIARLIGGRSALGHNRQIFFAAVSGYDLHGAQLTPHASLLADLSASMQRVL